MALTVHQNGGGWPWTNIPPVITSVEFKPLAGAVNTNGQRYHMWDATTSPGQSMYFSQGGSAGTTHYDIERNTQTDEWYDMHSDSPMTFEWSSSTTNPITPQSPGTTTGGANVLIGTANGTTNKYLHMFTSWNAYIGYIDTWSSFHTTTLSNNVQWTHYGNPIPINGTGREVQCTFNNTHGNAQNFTVQTTDPNGVTTVHHTFANVPALSAGGGYWIMDTDIHDNPTFYLIRMTQGGSIGSFTPSGQYYPAITSVGWGSLSGQNFPITYTHGNGLYWGQYGDQIRMVDDSVNGTWNNKVYFTYTVTNNGPVTINTGTNNGVDAFGATEYGNKTFILQIRNPTHNRNTDWHNVKKDVSGVLSDVTQQFNNQAPYSISGITWTYTNSNGNTVQVDFTQNNRTNEVVELWYKDTSNQHHQQTADNVGGNQITWNLLASGASDGEYYLKDGSGNYWPATNYYSNTYTYTAPPSGSLTIGTPTWTETGAGAAGNSAQVQFTVSNTTSNNARFDLRTNEPGQPQVDTITVNAGQSNVAVTLTHSSAGQSVWHRVYDHVNATDLQPTFTTAATTPPSSSVTVSTPTWTETGAGAAGNSVQVQFTVSNTTSNNARFDLRTNEPGQPTPDQVTVNAGQSNVAVTLTHSSAGQSVVHRVFDDANGWDLQPTFTTAATTTTTPPATSTTPSGGGIKRYPMVLTQLFNKKRSFYSIGMTHKDDIKLFR